MRLNVTLDYEEPLNLEEALGHIKVADDSGNLIRGSNVWVDDWFMALVEGVQALSRGEREYMSDIVSESYPLIFRFSGQGFSISFADATVAGDDLHNFELHLKAVIRQVLGEFGDNPEIHPDSFWVQLERYAKE